MSILGKFVKQPNEVLDYDVDYGAWFVGRGDTPASIATTTDPGITLNGYSLVGMIAKVILSGGIDGEKYKITVRLTTSSGIVREADFSVSVKED